LSEAPSFGKPAVTYDPHSRGSQAYVELGREFLKRFGEAGSIIEEAPVTTETTAAENKSTETNVSGEQVAAEHAS
jgi:hypothetical protein